MIRIANSGHLGRVTVLGAMALVPCPECGGQVSPAAVSCPHCGFPLSSPAAAPAAIAGPQPAAANGAAPGEEAVVWQGAPSLRGLAVQAIGTTLFGLVVTAAVVLVYDPALQLVSGLSRDAASFVADNEAGIRLAAILFVVTVVGQKVARLAWRALVLRSHHYRVSNQRLLIETGVLAKSINEIDMRTVEDITLQQTAVQRLFGVGEIAIVASDAGPGPGLARTRLRLLGVRDPRAVRELVRNAAYQATRSQVFMRAT